MITEESGGNPSFELDLALLGGFRFECRPDCGLCCFTSPRLEGDDEAGLQRAVPTVRTVVREGVRCIAARPHGGACELLKGLRCSAHTARPAPCREFPVFVHLGTRLQAGLVLSCPGLSLDALRGFGSVPGEVAFHGLDREVAAVRERLGLKSGRLLEDVRRRRKRVVRELSDQGRWSEEDEARGRLARRTLIPSAREYAPSELPDIGAGLERLPMFFDGRPGPMALAQAGEAWEVVELAPDGDSVTRGVAVPPERPPLLDPGAEELLSGYLRYFLARDIFLAAVHWDMIRGAEGTVDEVALSELRSIASDVLARAAVRAQLRGESGARLTALEVELGIRATDQDWLDRPAWGGRF